MYWRQVVAQHASSRPPDMPEARNFRGSFSGHERDHLFFNPKRRSDFIDVAYMLGLDFSDDGRSVAPVDIDGDGDLDLPMLSLQNLRLLENTLPRKNRRFTRIRLIATKTQHHALGAEVLVSSGGVTQRDFVKVNAGFQTQVPLDLHFGLGDTTKSKIDRIEVRWPSGATEVHQALLLDRLLILKEGQKAKAIVLPQWTSRSDVLPSGSQDIFSEAEQVEGKRARLAEPGKAVIINFWAPWCRPCEKELPELRKLHTKYGDKIRMVGISVETKNRDMVVASIKEHKLKYAQFYADAGLMESFFGGDGEARLPATFVFDSRGNLRRAFFRAIEFETLQSLVDSFDSQAADHQYLLTSAEAALGRGDFAAAESHLRNALRTNDTSAFVHAQLGTVLTMDKRIDEGMKHLMRAVKLDPQLPHAWYRLAWSEKEKGHFELALKHYKKAIALKPSDEKSRLGVGAMLSRLGKNRAAEKVFEALAKTQPKSVEAWLNLGKTRALLKQLNCIEAFERVLLLDPDNPEAQRLLAMVRQLR